MSQPDYEGIWQALFEHLRTVLGDLVVSCGRRHRIPPNLQPEMQPACFVLQGPHKVTPAKPAAKVTLRGFLVLYVYCSQDDEPIGEETLLAATVINGLLSRIDTALLPDNLRTGWFTLGGKVEHCWIEGDSHVEIDSIGAQSFAAIPISMLVP